MSLPSFHNDHPMDRTHLSPLIHRQSRSRSPSPGRPSSSLPSRPLTIPRRQLIFAAICVSILLWLLSFWPLITGRSPDACPPYEHTYDSCPTCSDSSLPFGSRPSESSQNEVGQKGKLLKNITIFDKPTHKFRGTPRSFARSLRHGKCGPTHLTQCLCVE